MIIQILWILFYVLAAFVLSIFAVATYRVAIGTDALSRAKKGIDDKVHTSEKVVAVMTRSTKKWWQKNKEVIQ